MIGSRLEIFKTRIRDNVQTIRSRVGSGCDLIAVVKAGAYGMGGEFVVTLAEAGVSRFAVATASEAVAVRSIAAAAEILVLGGFEDDDYQLFRDHQLIAALYDDREVPADIGIHVKIDTGMNRLGLAPERARRRVARLGSQVQGVFSHLASASTDAEFTRLQIARFEEATDGMGLFRHLSNSAGLAFADARLDAVRVGLALHGVSPGGIVQLAPVMRWKTRVLAVRDVAAGQTVGYGGTFEARRDSRVAVLPAGYADGYPRALSNKGIVEVAGRPAPVIGQVSMDLTSVDVTGIEGVERGDEVILLSADTAGPNSLESMCRRAGLIPWEVLTVIGERVERCYL